MVRSPARLKQSKWSYLRRRPRLYSKPTQRSFTVTWQDSTPNNTEAGKGSSCSVSSAETVPTRSPVNDPHASLLAQSKPDLLRMSPSLALDAVPPSFSTSSSDREEVIQHTLEAVRSGCESELEEDPIPRSVLKLGPLPSSGKALSELLPNLQPCKSIGLFKELCTDDEHSLISEGSREVQLVKRPLLNIIAERQPLENENLAAKGTSSSFGKERSRKKLDFEGDTNGVAVSTFGRQHGTVSTNESANLHGKEERSAEKESKSRHSKIHHVEVPKRSSLENEGAASAKKRMSDVASMSKDHSTPVTQKIQIKERSVYTYEMESQKHNLFGNQRVVAARKRIPDLAAFRPRSHSTPIAPLRHVTSNEDPSIPKDLGPMLLSRIVKRAALKLEAQPVSSDIFHAARNAPHMSFISPSTAAQNQQHRRASSHSLTKQRQHITHQDNIASGGAHKNNESSTGKACKFILGEQQDVCIRRRQDSDGAKQLSLSKHNQCQDCAEDMQASKKRLERHVSFFDDQRRHSERTVINNDVQSEAESPVIPKLQESSRTRKGKVDVCSEREREVLVLKLLKSGQTKSSRDAQCGTESPVMFKLQESVQAKKPRIDAHDLPKSPAIAKLQEHAQRKKRKKAKVWVRVQLYDHPNGQRAKSDVNMYDIYLSLALEIIEEKRQKCQSEKEKKVMKWFYKEVAKDATEIIDDVQMYTNELFELEKEMRKMRALMKKLYNIGLEVQEYVKENNIQGVDPFQFYFQEELYA
ncbi:uncharacterized protein LOC119436403 isoform X4 [Dermacentor silvarum]|uniref:uncharacterized protein LOC119436403 isoform X3 n=1 Tax=Dermacentor silvarum TaxID=543639 RepID=UPI00189A211B|nr:uncharacterized protein LOC119436403 isoform X3 [Dermacentor silvarum]XP_049513492.1 uncharacterized protein LOC119436403 isoform X4 [Dermacentor silvarum]